MSNATDNLSTLTEHERTPEEAALVMRLRMLTTMRWFAIAGLIITTLVASLGFHIGFPVLPVYAICVVMAFYNLFLLRQVRSLNQTKPELIVARARDSGYLHIILDLVTLTVLIHFTGGIENPFLFFFVFHIIAASIVLPYRMVYLFATMATVMVTLLVGLEYAGVIPHVNLVGFAPPTLYRQPSYILANLAALTAILYVTTYSATAISGELRKRQRQVVQLRERLLAEKTGQLEQASQSIAKLEEERKRFLRFIGMAAHDLKAPLTAIQGFLWVMLGGFAGDINNKQRHMLERSARRITELLNLISDLLDIPRIETGQIVAEMKEVSLGEVVNNSLEEQRHLASETGVKLEVQVPDGLPSVRGSAPRLQQVMTNLVNNAITYNTNEGMVTVTVREQDKNLLVEVTDTGLGIPPQELPRIFEDFYRASNVEGKKGTGLGLSITKRIVEAHGGRIWVESPSPDSRTGTRFSFTLPKMDKA